MSAIVAEYPYIIDTYSSKLFQKWKLADLTMKTFSLTAVMNVFQLYNYIIHHAMPSLTVSWTNLPSWQEVMTFSDHFHLELLYSSYFHTCYPSKVHRRHFIRVHTSYNCTCSWTFTVSYDKQDDRRRLTVHNYWHVFSPLNSPSPFWRGFLPIHCMTWS